MNQFSHEPIAKFLRCECNIATYSSPIQPPSPTYTFKAVSKLGALILSVTSSAGDCSIEQMDTNNNELTTATVFINSLEIKDEFNEETGKFQQFIFGIGPGGHFAINRTDTGFSVFYFISGDLSYDRSGPSERPSAGLVPNPEVAMLIAEAVWSQLYGAENIQRQKPFKIGLREGVWIVEGSYPDGVPTGIALARIRQEDGQLLQITHGQWPP